MTRHEHDEPSTSDDQRTWRDRGASLVEYALLIALITVVCIGALRAFGDENEGLIEGSANRIGDAHGLASTND